MFQKSTASPEQDENEVSGAHSDWDNPALGFVPSFVPDRWSAYRSARFDISNLLVEEWREELDSAAQLSERPGPQKSPLAIYVSRWRQDCDPTKRVQLQEVSVTAHDNIGAAVHRGLEELVVVWIARGLYRLHDLDDFDERRQADEQCISSFARHIAIKLGREQLHHQLPQLGDYRRGSLFPTGQFITPTAAPGSTIQVLPRTCDMSVTAAVDGARHAGKVLVLDEPLGEIHGAREALGSKELCS